MNKIKILAIALVVIMGLNSCEGDRGPQGPPGQDGMTLLGTTIDLNGVNLDNNGEFQYVFADDGIEVFEDDAVLDGLRHAAPVRSMLFFMVGSKVDVSMLCRDICLNS